VFLVAAQVKAGIAQQETITGDRDTGTISLALIAQQETITWDRDRGTGPMSINQEATLATEATLTQEETLSKYAG
jgi:hypothetical protein